MGTGVPGMGTGVLGMGTDVLDLASGLLGLGKESIINRVCRANVLLFQIDMEELEAKLHRTLIDLLTSGGMGDIAKLILDADLTIQYAGYNADGVSIDVPA